MSQPVKSRYTLEECYSVLYVHPKTFRRWLEQDKITPERSRADERIKFLTATQLERLAQLHDRPWPPVAEALEPEVIPVGAYKLLIDQVTQADRQAQQISTAQAELREQTTLRTQELEALRKESAAQLAEIRQNQAQVEQETMKRIDTLLEANKLKLSLLDEIEARLREATTRINDVEEVDSRQTQMLANLQQELLLQAKRQVSIQEQLQQELVGLQTQQRQVRSDLDALTTRYQELAVQQQRAQNDMQDQLEQNKVSMLEQIRQEQRGMQSEFHAALSVLHREMREELERRAQGIEQEQARDVAMMTATQGQEIERLEQRIASAATTAETAKRTAEGDKGRIFAVEQGLKNFDTQLQAHMMTASTLRGRVTQLETQASQMQGAAQEKPVRKTHTRKTGKTEIETEL